MNKSKMKAILQKRLEKAERFQQLAIRDNDDYQRGFWAGVAHGLELMFGDFSMIEEDTE